MPAVHWSCSEPCSSSFSDARRVRRETGPVPPWLPSPITRTPRPSAPPPPSHWWLSSVRGSRPGAGARLGPCGRCPPSFSAQALGYCGQPWRQGLWRWRWRPWSRPCAGCRTRSCSLQRLRRSARRRTTARRGGAWRQWAPRGTSCEPSSERRGGVPRRCWSWRWGCGPKWWKTRTWAGRLERTLWRAEPLKPPSAPCVRCPRQRQWRPGPVSWCTSFASSPARRSAPWLREGKRRCERRSRSMAEGPRWSGPWRRAR
mmetsp:Transcript_36154/g.78140  ORF Transcript_36154/g.78140 Transcript_36154/m.78140 type:complete len:258 (+) Transcript_36154:664-1437(+)